MESMKSFENKPSFQQLFCIIRDWNPKLFEDKNYLFGSKGGERYMNNEFPNHGLNKYFKNIYSYLMPSPGSHVNGSKIEFNRLNEEFTRELLQMFEMN